MLAGYTRVWLSIDAAIDYVISVAQCGQHEARDALIQAILDGEIKSRFGDNGLQDIKAFLWANAREWAPYSGIGARMPNRVRISGDAAYLRPYFDPPPDPELLPERLRPVELRREDIERLWAPPPAGWPVVVDARWPTGLPGRPSKGKNLIESEFKRRCCSGELKASLDDEAGALCAWYIATYPKAQHPTVKTVKNNIRADHRRWAVSQRQSDAT